MRIDPKETTIKELHGMMLGAVAPRPIAFASTVDKEGNPNLAPFSFFNAIGSNPPTLIFSPARSGRTNTQKDTFDNLKETGEVVINSVSYAMVHQVSLASAEYPKGVNEFVKAGFTPIASEKVKPFRVKESPTQMECIVKQIIETGETGGAGNIVVCELVLMHVNDSVLDESNHIDPHKIDLVGRMSANYYSRASGDAVFEVRKPSFELGIGVDSIPENIRFSRVLTGNDLGQLGGIAQLPKPSEVEEIRDDAELKEIFKNFSDDKSVLEYHLHLYAQRLIAEHHVEKAWKVLLAGNS